MDNFIGLIFTLIAVIFLIYFGYQLDEKGHSHPQVALNRQLAKFFFLYNKKGRTYFSLTALLIESSATLFGLVSILLFILTFVIENNDFDFAYSVYAFSFCAIVALIYIIKLIILFIKEIKSDWKNRE
ncbi:MAG: hypothetical protein WCS49_01665 [Bacilli bacterium]